MSIRSGRGRSTHDRVLRLRAVFETAEEAMRHAVSQGLAWVAESAARNAHGAAQPE